MDWYELYIEIYYQLLRFGLSPEEADFHAEEMVDDHFNWHWNGVLTISHKK